MHEDCCNWCHRRVIEGDRFCSDECMEAYEDEWGEQYG